MLRTLFTSKIVLVAVALIPWVVGEVASMSGCAAPCPTASAQVAPADCLVYETASGRLVTVKAPSSSGSAADCLRI